VADDPPAAASRRGLSSSCWVYYSDDHRHGKLVCFIARETVFRLPYLLNLKQPLLMAGFYHMLSASMKGLVALSGLEAMSNGIQFVKNEDFGLVKWGKKHMPKWQGFWNFYSGKSGIGRMVQTSFLFTAELQLLSWLTSPFISMSLMDAWPQSRWQPVFHRF